MKWLKANQTHLGFLLTLFSLLGLFALAFFKSVEVTGTIPVILATFLGARASERIMNVQAASKDPSSNTRQVINDLEHGPGHNVDNPDA